MWYTTAWLDAVCVRTAEGQCGVANAATDGCSPRHHGSDSTTAGALPRHMGVLAWIRRQVVGSVVHTHKKDAALRRQAYIVELEALLSTER